MRLSITTVLLRYSVNVSGVKMHWLGSVEYLVCVGGDLRFLRSAANTLLAQHIVLWILQRMILVICQEKKDTWYSPL